MTTITEQFIDCVCAVNYDTLPPAAIDMARQVTLDGIAVILAGSTEPLGVGRISTAYVREMGGHPQASVITGGFKTSMGNAAYANGTRSLRLAALELVKRGGTTLTEIKRVTLHA